MPEKSVFEELDNSPEFQSLTPNQKKEFLEEQLRGKAEWEETTQEGRFSFLMNAIYPQTRGAKGGQGEPGMLSRINRALTATPDPEGKYHGAELAKKFLWSGLGSVVGAGADAFRTPAPGPLKTIPAALGWYWGGEASSPADVLAMVGGNLAGKALGGAAVEKGLSRIINPESRAQRALAGALKGVVSQKATQASGAVLDPEKYASALGSTEGTLIPAIIGAVAEQARVKLTPEQVDWVKRQTEAAKPFIRDVAGLHQKVKDLVVQVTEKRGEVSAAKRTVGELERKAREASPQTVAKIKEVREELGARRAALEELEEELGKERATEFKGKADLEDLRRVEREAGQKEEWLRKARIRAEDKFVRGQQEAAKPKKKEFAEEMAEETEPAELARLQRAEQLKEFDANTEALAKKIEGRKAAAETAQQKLKEFDKETRVMTAEARAAVKANPAAEAEWRAKLQERKGQREGLAAEQKTAQVAARKKVGVGIDPEEADLARRKALRASIKETAVEPSRELESVPPVPVRSAGQVTETGVTLPYREQRVKASERVLSRVMGEAQRKENVAGGVSLIKLENEIGKRRREIEQTKETLGRLKEEARAGQKVEGLEEARNKVAGLETEVGKLQVQRARANAEITRVNNLITEIMDKIPDKDLAEKAKIRLFITPTEMFRMGRGLGMPQAVSAALAMAFMSVSGTPRGEAFKRWAARKFSSNTLRKAKDVIPALTQAWKGEEEEDLERLKKEAAAGINP